VKALEGSKDTLSELFGLSHDVLHVHVGLGIFFVVLLVGRRRLGNWLPVWVVLAAALTGEVFDFLALTGNGQDRFWSDHVIDIFNTTFWPVMLTLFGRWGLSRRRE
jgi:hypothetical protein